jgi:hypothetical protein
MNKIILFLFLQFTVTQIFGQITPSFQAPLKIPLILSGNFGEIRSDHFHSGIDIKTRGSIGHAVFAIESGYVSRIKVQANGYGKSIYLAHPDGHTSVYGHLDRYREDLEAYVEKIQYSRQSHQLDLYLKSGDFPIEKGEMIAYSGNSGGSMGPHLHFEIRNSANQHPTNVLQYEFDIKDDIAPRFKQLMIYPLEEGALVNGSHKKQSFDLVIDQGVYTIPWGTKLEVSGAIGIGVEVYDYLDSAPNRCGIYSLEGYLDEGLFYQQKMEEFSFSETRYVNAHIDYGEKINSGRKVQRLYRLPNDKLRIYGQMENNGALVLTEPGIRSIKVLASDVAGNQSQIFFKLKVNEFQEASSDKQENISTLMKYNELSLFEKEGVKIEVPANSLFENINFTYAETPPTNGFLSVNYQVHSKQTPLFKPFTLSVTAPDVSPELEDKLIFVTYDPEEGKVISAGGAYSRGRVVASLRHFGEYAVSMDTIAPEITPLKGTALSDQSGRKSLRFTILDELSGIKKYEGFIDNRWVLFEYDPKNDLLSYTFDKERISSNSEHELELYISDSQGNVNLYHSTFTW